MKGKYITTQILLACKAKPVGSAINVRDQRTMPDELKRISKPRIGERAFELVAA